MKRKMLTWLRGNAKNILLFLMLTAIPFLTVLIMEVIKNFLPRWFDKSQWGALVAGLWAYVGTTLLGFLAFSQNRDLARENKRLHEIEELRKRPRVQIIIDKIATDAEATSAGTMLFVKFRGYGQGALCDVNISKATATHREINEVSQFKNAYIAGSSDKEKTYVFSFLSIPYNSNYPIEIKIEYFLLGEDGRSYQESKTIKAVDAGGYGIIYFDMENTKGIEK